MRDVDEREVLIEAELSRVGRNRVQVNKQKLGRTRDLLGVMRVSVFAPDDLVMIKGGPGERRRFLDDTLVALKVSYDAMRLELDRVVRQRNTLLKQAGGRLTDEIAMTLDVWDDRLAELGDQLGYARATLVSRCQPMVLEAYEQLAGESGTGRTGLRARVAFDRAGRCPGRGPGAGRPPRCVDGRPAPRRGRDRAQRAAGAHACLAG